MTRNPPRPSLFGGAFLALTALLTAITAPNGTGPNGQPSRKSSRSSKRFTRPGTPGPQQNLYRMPWKAFCRKESKERAHQQLGQLEDARGSQAVMRARSVRTADGWRTRAVSDAEQLRVARNQRRAARRRFAA
jgi:hypothetical protein